MAEYIKVRKVFSFLVAVARKCRSDRDNRTATILERVAYQILRGDTKDKITVIQCKNCQWYSKGENPSDSWEYCKFHKFNVYDEFFCRSSDQRSEK